MKKGISALLVLAVMLSVLVPSCFASKSFQVGDIVQFGSYEQDNSKENGKEPIAWQLFNVEGDKLILLSKYILDRKTMHPNEDPGLTWGASELRSWLNGYSSDANAPETDYSEDNFISSAFTDEEKQEILLSRIDSSMEDYIYLLSGGNP